MVSGAAISRAKSTKVIYDSPEITHPMNLEDHFDFGFKERHNAETTEIEKLDLEEKEKMYYLFDFGDEWWHELTVLKVLSTDNSKGFPRIIKASGESPEQYPNYEDDEEDDDF